MHLKNVARSRLCYKEFMRTVVTVSLAALVGLILPSHSLGFDWSGRIDQLADNLQAPSPSVRRQTLERLGTYPPSHVARYLLTALEDENIQVRVTAARLLGRGHVEEAVPQLVGWLTDQEEELRVAACTALGRIGDDRAVAPLSRVMGDASADVRQAAVEALAAIGTQGATVPIISRLGDTHPRVRQTAAEGLGRLVTPEAVVPLVSRLQDPVQPVRIAVIGALARIGDQRSSAALVQSLRDPSPEVRASALTALARLRADEAVVPAIGLLTDENEAVRNRAVAVLGAIGTDRAVEALVHCLRDSALSPAAVNSLVEVGSTAVPPLCDVVRQSSDRLARASALNVLVRIGDPEAGTTVIDELETGGGGLPEISLIAALGEIVSEDGLLVLLERTDHDDENIRRAALISLAAYLQPGTQEPRASEALLNRLDSGTSQEKLLALVLLSRIGDIRAVGLAAEISTDGARSVEAAEQLLQAFGPGEHSGLREEITSALATGWPVRAAAIRVLGASGQAAAVEPLLEVLASNRRAPLRHEAALALGQLGGAEVVGRLTTMLRSAEPVDRTTVIMSLGTALADTPTDDARQALEALLGEGESALALRAADALARAGDQASVDALANLLGRPEVVLRRKAVDVLGELGGDQARTALLSALSDDDPLVRGLAAWGLGKVGGPGVSDALVEALDDQGWSVAINAAGALARLGDPATGEPICSALDDTRGIIHLQANLLMAAAATNAPCALPQAMEAFRQDQVPMVRSSAARVIGRLTSVGEDQDSDDSESDAETAAARALLRTCVSEDRSPRVQSMCRESLETSSQGDGPAAETWIEFYLYAADGRRLRPRGRFLLVLPDGLIKAGVTDSNAFSREAPVAEGEFSVQDPSSIRRSQT